MHVRRCQLVVRAHGRMARRDCVYCCWHAATVSRRCGFRASGDAWIRAARLDRSRSALPAMLPAPRRANDDELP